MSGGSRAPLRQLQRRSAFAQFQCCRFLIETPRHNGPDAGEHLAADLPGVVSSTPRIGHLCSGKRPADGIHQLTTYRITRSHGRDMFPTSRTC